MKKIISFFCIIMLCLSIQAQVPQAFNYQAVARNNAGAPLINSSVAIRVSIHDSTASGVVVYAERDTATTNGFGLFSVSVGTGNVISGTFNTINWSHGNKFMEVDLDPTGGSSYTNMGTTQLLSVPYAMHARTADSATNVPSVWGVSGSNIYNTNSGNVGIGTNTPAPSAALEINSTTGSLLMPRMTKAQRDALTAVPGMVIYNTDTGKFQGYATAEKLDQSFTNINNGGGEDRAQSFTADLTGSLTKIELPLGTMGGSYTVNVAILYGDGVGGPVLSTQQFTIASGSTTWYPIYITGVNVIAGNIYTIHLTTISSCGGPICYNWGMDANGNNYAGGTFYYSGIPYNGGSTDCAFKTYVMAAEWVDLH